jgi:arabinofuranan 3-O-arabinosyltransferase
VPLTQLRLRTIAICWIAVAVAAYVFDLLRQTHEGLTNGAGRPLGDDFINYWSAPFLAWHGRGAEIYNWDAFHAFEVSVAGPSLQFYHYSYPPTHSC